MALQNTPDGWPPARLAAFNQLLGAIESYMAYDYAIGKLGITDAVLLQRRTDLGNMIRSQLGPAFRDA